MGNRKLTVLALLAIGLCAVSATVALTAATMPHPGIWAAIAAVNGAALLGVGLYAWNRGGQGRFGQVLFATGLIWFLATLSNSDSDLIYSVGRIAGWVFEVALIYALVSYPTGRLEGRGPRLLAGGAAALVALLYLPTVPFVEQYPLPTAVTGCVDACPVNAFFSGTEPAIVDDLVRPLREVLTILVYLSVAILLALRLRAAGHNLKRTLVPVLGAAVLRLLAASAYVILRRVGADDAALEVARMVAMLTIPLTALGFLVGLLQWRIYSAGALSRLTTGLAVRRDPAEIRELLAESLEEPAVGLYYAPADGEGWLDPDGRDAVPPSPSPAAAVSESRAASGLRAVVVCDRGFEDFPGFLGAVSSCVIAGLERHRLDLALTESLRSATASRKRLVSAADEARRRIERDLHDGAQQQLVTLRVKLELTREALERDPAGATEMLAALGSEVEEIIEEVRSLARGIYPPLLASDGLGEALRAAARRSPLAVSVDADGIGRLPPESESAVYFCCLEALQNAAKHAAGASAVRIELRGGEELRFEVADDGCGFAVGGPPQGSGLTGMHDRLAAVGGELWVDSAPGQGTRVRGRLPLD